MARIRECKPVFMDKRRIECACGRSLYLTAAELVDFRREEKRNDMLLDKFNEHRETRQGK